MFLCEKCARKVGVSEFELIFGYSSYGPCELCKEVNHCVDAHDFGNKQEDDKKGDDPMT